MHVPCFTANLRLRSNVTYRLSKEKNNVPFCVLTKFFNVVMMLACDLAV